jgi:hypothetical protein
MYLEDHDHEEMYVQFAEDDFDRAAFYILYE